MEQRGRGAARLGAVAGRSSAELKAVNCHHNYVAREHHYGKNVLVTRKGAVRAREGDLGIIPGSMGARSLHRPRQGQRGELSQLQPRRGPRDVAQRGEAPLHRWQTTSGRRRASSAARTPT